jgi:hypothetical protein
MDQFDGDNTGNFNQMSIKKSETGRGLDDSKSFHIDMGKYKIQDNYMYGGGSRGELDDSVTLTHSFDNKREVSGTLNQQMLKSQLLESSELRGLS